MSRFHPRFMDEGIEALETHPPSPVGWLPRVALAPGRILPVKGAQMAHELGAPRETVGA